MGAITNVDFVRKQIRYYTAKDIDNAQYRYYTVHYSCNRRIFADVIVYISPH